MDREILRLTQHQSQQNNPQQMEWWHSVDTTVMWTFTQIRTFNKVSSLLSQYNQLHYIIGSEPSISSLPIANAFMTTTGGVFKLNRFILNTQKTPRLYIETVNTVLASLFSISAQLLKYISQVARSKCYIALLSTCLANIASVISLFNNVQSIIFIANDLQASQAQTEAFISGLQSLIPIVIDTTLSLLGLSMIVIAAIGVQIAPPLLLSLSIASASFSVCKAVWQSLPIDTKRQLKQFVDLGKGSYNQEQASKWSTKLFPVSFFASKPDVTKPSVLSDNSKMLRL